MAIPRQAEYLYKKQGNSLAIALQTGFDVETGKQRHGRRDYYAGDLALSFDGDSSSYEYAFDFGNTPRDIIRIKLLRWMPGFTQWASGAMMSTSRNPTPLP